MAASEATWMSISAWHIAWTSSMQIVTALARGMASVLVALVMGLATVAFYRVYLHPLAGIPGPQLAALSSCWYAYQARNGRMLHLGKTLHKKYGPVVRVAPNEVWFDSKDAFRIIYSELPVLKQTSNNPLKSCHLLTSLIMLRSQIPQVAMRNQTFIVRDCQPISLLTLLGVHGP